MLFVNCELTTTFYIRVRNLMNICKVGGVKSCNILSKILIKFEVMWHHHISSRVGKSAMELFPIQFSFSNIVWKVNANGGCYCDRKFSSTNIFIKPCANAVIN